MRGYLAVLLTSVIKCLLLSAGGGTPRGVRRDSNDPRDTRGIGTGR